MSFHVCLNGGFSKTERLFQERTIEVPITYRTVTERQWGQLLDNILHTFLHFCVLQNGIGDSIYTERSLLHFYLFLPLIRKGANIVDRGRALRDTSVNYLQETAGKEISELWQKYETSRVPSGEWLLICSSRRVNCAESKYDLKDLFLFFLVSS